jgi:hypothetical protein
LVWLAAQAAWTKLRLSQPLPGVMRRCRRLPALLHYQDAYPPSQPRSESETGSCRLLLPPAPPRPRGDLDQALHPGAEFSRKRAGHFLDLDFQFGDQCFLLHQFFPQQTQQKAMVLG